MTRPPAALNFKIPIYLIQGENDLLTPMEISKPYFEQITSPAKEYFLLPQTAHGFNAQVLSTLFRICRGLKE